MTLWQATCIYHLINTYSSSAGVMNIVTQCRLNVKVKKLTSDVKQILGLARFIWSTTNLITLIYLAADLVSKSLFGIRGNLLTNKLMSQEFHQSYLVAIFRKFYNRYNNFIHPYRTFPWATYCVICFIPIVKPFLTRWSWLRFVPFT
jgi:hypothetical protein